MTHTSTKIITIFAILLSNLALTACQKAEPETTSDNIVQDNTVQSDTAVLASNTAQNSPEYSSADTQNTDAQHDGESTNTPQVTQIDDTTITTSPDIQVEKVNDVVTISNTDTPPPSSTNSASNMPIEEQITDVDYRSESGIKLKVTFQTSAINELQANVTLPSGKKVLLTAPEGQGNNPTYRSEDGNIELVSHGGGGSVDLLQNGKLTNFDAVSAEAEVVVKE